VTREIYLFQFCMNYNNTLGAFYKMLGCFNPNLGKIWTNPNVGLKMQLKKYS